MYVILHLHCILCNLVLEKKNHSTVTTNSYLLKYIKYKLDKSGVVGAVFLDLKKHRSYQITISHWRQNLKENIICTLMIRLYICRLKLKCKLHLQWFPFQTGWQIHVYTLMLIRLYVCFFSATREPDPHVSSRKSIESSAGV